MNRYAKNVAVNSWPISLSQFLKWAGAARTGGEAKALIKGGLVQLNGAVCRIPGQRLHPGDILGVLRQPMQPGQKPYIETYKAAEA